MIMQSKQLTKEMVDHAKQNGLLDKIYGQEVTRLVRLKYSQSEVEAIINNYLSDPTNSQRKAEFDALQSYRNECKVKARATIDSLLI